MTRFKEATPDTLNEMIEFDSPFEVIGGYPARVDATMTNADIYAPEVFWLEVALQDSLEIASDDWEAVDGFSGQQGYSGPIMHPSEFLGGSMARYVLENPGIYCITEVINPTSPEDPNYSEDPIGWALLRKKK